MASSAVAALASRSSFTHRSWAVPKLRSTRPFACGLRARISSTPSSRSARPNCVSAPGSALGDLLIEPEELNLSHIRPTVSLERRLRALRDALGRRTNFDFDDEFGGEDRLTQAVTVFALLELYRKGEVTWEQKEPFGPITVKKASA